LLLLFCDRGQSSSRRENSNHRNS
jgi:hypothetical protein